MSETAPALLNLDEFEEAACKALSPMGFAYVAGGAADEVTLRSNREAYARWRLVPRVLRGVERCRLNTTVVGQDIALPVLLAPVGTHRLVHPDGELACARAARTAGTIFVLSTVASYSIEEVAAETDRWWFQLYFARDRGITQDLVERAEAAGAQALVLTVDLVSLGRRERDIRLNFTLPDMVRLANFNREKYQTAVAAAAGKEPAPLSPTHFMETALSWADVDWLRTLTRLPLLIKGILSPADARLCVEHGAAGIIVSNHGGRQLDHAIPTLDALPGIAEAVDGRIDVLVDGGVRRGTDVLKALALGARAVQIGRPYVYGLAVDGEQGVSRVLELLRAELAVDMHLCGVAGLDQIDRSLLARAGTLPGTGE